MEQQDEAERLFLSAVILRPSIADETDAAEAWFLSPDSRRVFSAIRKIRAAGHRPEVQAIARESGLSVADIMGIEGASSSAANFRYYESILRERWRDRGLKALASELVDHSETPEKRFEIAERRILELSTTATGTAILSPREMGARFSETIRTRYENRGKSVGPQTGIDVLDSMILGFEPRLLYVIGGRPSAGKSAAAQGMAVNLAVTQKVPVGMISLESSADEVFGRVYSNVSGVDGRRIKSGFLSSGDFEKLDAAREAVSGAPLYVWDKPNASFREVRGIIRYMVRAYHVRVVFVDYLQLVKWPGAADKTEAAASVSTGLKEIAREFGIAVVALAQLRREADERKPSMGDFQWASQIEQDADAIVLLWHPESGEDKKQDRPEKSYMVVAKCRDGCTGMVPVMFERPLARYRDYPEPKEGEK